MLDPGGVIAFIAIFSQITRPVRTFIDQFANINQGIAAGERIFRSSTRNPKQDKPRRPGTHGAERKSNSATCTSPTTGARSDRRHFVRDTPRADRGSGRSLGRRQVDIERVAAPRSTTPSAGDILIDGVSLRDYTQDRLRAHMSVVAQDTVLFNDTIENNIGMGRRGATHEEVVEAARSPTRDCFIRECTDGYGTNIGDRGVKLSGGQRQRLSIARAVLKNPEILILDEATSALDTESEKLVQDALNKLLKGRTSVVIAHRLSTIHNADLIVVVDHGRIAEQGTHNELMERNGIYAKLIELQSFD